MVKNKLRKGVKCDWCDEKTNNYLIMFGTAFCKKCYFRMMKFYKQKIREEMRF